MILTQIPPEYTHLLPDRAIQDIASAMQYGRLGHRLKDVEEEIQAGARQVWLKYTDDMVHTGTVVTRVVEADNTAVCIVDYAGGQGFLEDFHEVTEPLEEWARYNGCSSIHISGRRGWRKVLQPHGYEEEYVIFSKDIATTNG